MTQFENIVVVGGGYAGVRLAQTFEKKFSFESNNKFRIILVDKKSYFYHIIAGPRAAVEHINNVIPYTHTFRDNEKNIVVQATVVGLNKNTLYLDKPFEGSMELPFAYAVIATGIRYPTPSMLEALDIETANQEQREIQTMVKEANSILIVGGGPTGVEVVGEIREKYADKKITLVHDQKRLLNDDIPDTPRAQMLEKVQRNNVKVILDDIVELSDNNQIKKTIYKPKESLLTRKGVKLDVDLVMLMFGMSAATQWLKDTPVPLATRGGFIKVKPTLQVDAPGFENVYAAGDVADIDEFKLAGRSTGHTRVITTNIQSSINGKEPTRTYKANNKFLMGITFGKKQGYIFTPFGSLGDWAIAFAKGRTLSTKRFWGMLNLREPNKL
ncbi:hypothetical protein BDC45DRAFT_87655 [Circinella umbellata]|nr:hypothetical protein BDC45DRAFT_87655 [Circinella umbellata]